MNAQVSDLGSTRADQRRHVLYIRGGSHDPGLSACVKQVLGTVMDAYRPLGCSRLAGTGCLRCGDGHTMIIRTVDHLAFVIVHSHVGYFE